MPVNGEQYASFLGVKGENCSFIHIKGLKTLCDDRGNDLLELIRNGKTSKEDCPAMSNILGRLGAIEKYLQSMPMPEVAKEQVVVKEVVKDDALEKKLMARIVALEKALSEQPVPESGPPGIQGPRGAPGAKMIKELLDVNLDGLDDGAMLTWSGKQKKWVISLEE